MLSDPEVIRNISSNNIIADDRHQYMTIAETTTPPIIVVLDGATLNPGDNPWTELESLGTVRIYERSTAEEAVQRSQGASVVVVNKCRLAADFFLQTPSVRMVAVSATGWDCVDGQAASQAGVVVCNVPVYGTDSVAQFTFALILELSSHVAIHQQAVQDGEWTRSPNFSFWKRPLMELAGHTLGLIGYGRIGQKVAELGRAFGMNVIAARSKNGAAQPEHHGVQITDLETVLRTSDILSLHCPLTSETRGLICERTLRLMKPTAILINTSRGALVAENDLTEALNSGRLAAAGLDVVSQEPITADNPLLNARNCLLTPHIAWATQAARRRLLAETVKNVAAFLNGTPTNVVNRPPV